MSSSEATAKRLVEPARQNRGPGASISWVPTRETGRGPRGRVDCVRIRNVGFGCRSMNSMDLRHLGDGMRSLSTVGGAVRRLCSRQPLDQEVIKSGRRAAQPDAGAQQRDVE